MTRDDVIRMAQEAGDDVEHTLPSDLDSVERFAYFMERFASLVAAAEREACAHILEQNAAACRNNAMLFDVLMGNVAAIRARGESDAP